jgi:hypothetical protein
MGDGKAGRPAAVSVQIVRLVDDESFPNWVAAELLDVSGRLHTFIDKEPIFSTGDAPIESFPCGGVIRCEVVDTDPALTAASRPGTVTIDTGRPDGVASTEEVTRFIVFEGQLFKD